MIQENHKDVNKKHSLNESDYKWKFDGNSDDWNIFGSNNDENDSDYIRWINKEVENTLN